MKEEGSSATDSVTDVTDITDVTDVTDFSPMKVGRRKKEEGRVNNSNSLSDRKCSNRLVGCYI